MSIDISQLKNLPPEERHDIIGELWESLTNENGDIDFPQWHKDELDRRDREEPDDTPGRPWREVINEIRQGHQ